MNDESIKLKAYKEGLDIALWIIECNQMEICSEDLDIEENNNSNNVLSEDYELLKMIGVVNEGANLDGRRIIKDLKATLKENTKQIKSYMATGKYDEAKKCVEFAKKEIKKAKAEFEKIDQDSLISMITGNWIDYFQTMISCFPYLIFAPIAASIKSIKSLIAQIRQIVSDVKNDNFTAGTLNSLRAKFNAYFDEMTKTYDKIEKEIASKKKSK